ncbi:hypothetical protein KSW81_004892 [Nannochloris sp. 'desiccata']|nr:hypothetical protein KSW81_004892 [Chlorella desiccata (nom. nud.)]
MQQTNISKPNMRLFATRGPKDVLKSSKQNVKDSIRELDRELTDMKREEAKLTEEIRAAARAGNDASVRMLAQQMVRLKEHTKRIQITRAGIGGVSATLSTAASNAVMASSLQQAGKAMSAVGTAVDPGKLQQNMKQFGKQSEIQSMQQSMLDEALDAALDTDDIGEESNMIFQQVLEEVGAELASKMVDTPQYREKMQQQILARAPMRAMPALGNKTMTGQIVSQRMIVRRSGSRFMKIEALAVGDKLPADLKFNFFDAEGNMQEITVGNLTKGKKVVLFAVPGAFTPTCSLKHLPGFIEKADELKSKGVDTIACISVNDAFVMDAWGKSVGADGKILMLADGSAVFAKAIGAELDLNDKGLGVRSRRYAMLVDDGAVKVLNLEEGGAFTVSSADDILSAL